MGVCLSGNSFISVGLYLFIFLILCHLYSLKCVKKAIMMDSGNYSYWNALGVIAMSKGKQRLHIDTVQHHHRHHLHLHCL